MNRTATAVHAIFGLSGAGLPYFIAACGNVRVRLVNGLLFLRGPLITATILVETEHHESLELADKVAFVTGGAGRPNHCRLFLPQPVRIFRSLISMRLLAKREQESRSEGFVQE